MASSGFQSNDVNCYKIVGQILQLYLAHLCDKWMTEISDQIVSKKTSDKDKDLDERLQISTEDVVEELS